MKDTGLLATRNASLGYVQQRGIVFDSTLRGSDWFGFNSNAGVTTEERVTPESGSKITTVWNCLNLISQDVASMEFQVRKRLNRGADKIKDNLYYLINSKPNRIENAWQFWYGMVFMGEGWGNSYAYIVRDGVGSPKELIRLAPWRVTPRIYDNELFYIVDGNFTIAARDMFHYRSFVLDEVEGVSKIVYNANLMGLKQKQSRFAERSTGNKPPGYLYSKDSKKEQRDDILQAWNKNISGDKISGTPFLFGDVQYQQLMLTPEAADIVDMTEWTDINTFGIWRVQPVMLGRHKDSNYGNAEQQSIIHTKTLTPYLTCLEQEANAKLLSERQKITGYYTNFNERDLMRGDLAALSNFIQSMTTVGHINSDEVRTEFLDMEPQADGKGSPYYQQGAMMEKGTIVLQNQNNQPNK